MIKRKIFIPVIIILFSTLSMIAYVSIRGNNGVGNNLIAPQNIFQGTPLLGIQEPTPTPTILPTPTPIAFDKNSNLKEEVEKLTPDDFSEDFKTLKQEASIF